jgi:hypothetical protein
MLANNIGEPATFPARFSRWLRTAPSTPDVPRGTELLDAERELGCNAIVINRYGETIRIGEKI